MRHYDSGASAGGAMVAFLSGMTLGVVAALLMAPQTGQESRDTVARMARRAGHDMRGLSERATGTWDDVVDKGREVLNEAGGIVREAVDAGREAMQSSRRSASEKSRASS